MPSRGARCEPAGTLRTNKARVRTRSGRETSVRRAREPAGAVRAMARMSLLLATMITIRSRLYARSLSVEAMCAAPRLELPFEGRREPRQRAQLDSGEEVMLDLPRGELLRGGDWLLASDGRAIQVVAQAEPLLHAELGSVRSLARAAYQLGRRRVPVHVGEGWLRIVPDAALERMLRELGAKVAALEAAFEPE